MSIANRREYLRQPVGWSTIDEVLRAMPIGGARSGILGAALGAAGTGFSPADISSLAHWYDATVISGSDGDAIGTWTDQEGSDDLTQATSSAKPTLKTGIINGEQILRFDGSDDVISGGFGSSITQPDQIFTVAKKRSSGQDSRETIHESESNNNRQLLDSPVTSTWRIYSGSSLDSGTADDTNAHIYTTLYNGASSVLRLDASQIASGDAGSEDLPSLSVGADHTPEYFGDYDVGEILVYSADLSDTDRNDVESYLSDKWGITI